MDQKHDQKQFLDLLQVHKSEDAKKARRNFSFVSFIVISAWILGIQLTEIKVFGVDLSRSSELYILVIAFLLLAYWASMFFLSYRHDSEIQKEREIHLNLVVEQIFNRWSALEKNLKAKGVRAIKLRFFE